jgi:hypothetical protein
VQNECFFRVMKQMSAIIPRARAPCVCVQKLRGNMSEMRNLLETHSVAEIKSPPPVYFSTEDTFAKAYGAIVSNKILSAPLWHRAEKRWYIGCI